MFIGNHIYSTSQDQYVKIILDIFALKKQTVPFIQELIVAEFMRSRTKEELFRQNTFCTKVLTLFGRRTSQEFISRVLKNSIEKIISSNVQFEVDESKIQPPYTLRDNLMNLCNACEEIIKSLTDNMTNVPIEIRTICACLWENCVKYYPSDKELPSIIVGGFLFLRMICPAIASPENFGLVDINFKVSLEARRNLVLVTKVLQNITNQVVQMKEKSNNATAHFIKQHLQTLRSYSWYISTQTIILTDNKLDESFIEITGIDINELFSLHQLLFQLWKEIENDPQFKDTEEKKLLNDVYDIIGVPPFLVAKRLKKANTEECDKEILKFLEEKHILYRGTSLVNGDLVFYIVVRNFVNYLIQLKLTSKDNTFNDIVDMLTIMLTGIVEAKPYIFIIDFSWFCADDLTQNFLVSTLGSIPQLHDSLRSHFKKMYLLHAGKNIKKKIEDIKLNPDHYGLPEGWEKNTEMIDDWHDLLRMFGDTEIAIPETSKGYAKRDFCVWRVMKKSKVQPRVLLTTFERILEIDSESKTILSYIDLKNIDEFVSYEKVPLMIFKFQNGEEDRHYLLPSMESRESLLTQLYVICFKKTILSNERRKVTIEVLSKKNKKKSSKSIIICSDRFIVVKNGTTITHTIIYASIDKLLLIENPKNPDSKIFIVDYRVVKNGVIEKVSCKFSIRREDENVKDTITQLMFNDFK